MGKVQVEVDWLSSSKTSAQPISVINKKPLQNQAKVSAYIGKPLPIPPKKRIRAEIVGDGDASASEVLLTEKAPAPEAQLTEKPKKRIRTEIVGDGDASASEVQLTEKAPAPEAQLT